MSPLAGLDDNGRMKLRTAIEAFLEQGTAVAVITHEPEWAGELVGQRIHLADGVTSRAGIEASP